MLHQGEKLEQLGPRVAVITGNGVSFGEDALLLASFEKPKAGFLSCDFGTGCGVIPLCWCLTGRRFRVDAVEIQPQVAEMAARSVHGCGLQQVVRVVCGDYLDPSLLLPGRYDFIVCNPPYVRRGGGRPSADPSRRTARQETRTTFSEICVRAASLLKNGGRFCFCQRPERLAECVSRLRRNGLEPKRMRLVQRGPGERPWLFLMEARRSAREGLRVEPVLMAGRSGEAGAPPENPPAGEAGPGPAETFGSAPGERRAL